MGGCSPSREELPCRRLCATKDGKSFRKGGGEEECQGEVEHHIAAPEEDVSAKLQVKVQKKEQLPLAHEYDSLGPEGASPVASNWDSMRGRSSGGGGSERMANLFPPQRFLSRDSREKEVGGLDENDSSMEESDKLAKFVPLESTSDASTSLCSEVVAELESDEVDTETTKSRRRPPRRKLGGKKETSSTGIVIDNTSDITTTYTFTGEVLASGQFGPVKRAIMQATGAPRAVRQVKKTDAEAYLKKAVKIMKAADHPNIISLHELFEDAQHLYMVMELCEGGTVKEWVVKQERRSEVQCAMLMQQIMRALFYLHTHSICHRNLAAENILLVNSALIEKNMAKVIGFGSACYLKKRQVLQRRCGVPSHMAPEMISGKYDKACDIWSAGVILYELVMRKLPFQGATQEQLEENIMQSAVTLGDKASPSCVELVGLLLSRNPKARYTVEQAMEHQWILKAAPKLSHAPLNPALLSRLEGFRSLNVFKRSALQVVATMLGQSDTALPRRIFHSLDTNGDGLLSVQELKDRILLEARKQDLSSDEIRSIKLMFSNADAAGGGLKAFGYTEFVAATFDRKACLQDNVLRAAFGSFDKNGDGLISMGDLAQGRLLGHLSLEELAQVLEELDLNEDHYVDFSEFLSMMRSGND